MCVDKDINIDKNVNIDKNINVETLHLLRHLGARVDQLEVAQD